MSPGHSLQTPTRTDERICLVLNDLFDRLLDKAYEGRYTVASKWQVYVARR